VEKIIEGRNHAEFKKKLILSYDAKGISYELKQAASDAQKVLKSGHLGYSNRKYKLELTVSEVTL
jgi:hypothetical protein